MKLVREFFVQEVGGMTMAVAPEFRGMLRMNPAGKLIVEMLQNDTTEEAIVDALFANFNQPREVLAADVREVIDILRKAKLIDE